MRARTYPSSSRNSEASVMCSVNKFTTMRYARVTRSGPELCRARRRRSGSSGQSRESGPPRRRARYHRNRRDSTGPTPPPFLAASSVRRTTGLCVAGRLRQIAASTYNSLNARSRTPRRQPRQIASKLPRVGPLLAAALGALQQCWSRRSAAVARVSASDVEYHHWACRRRAGGTHAAPRRADCTITVQPFSCQSSARRAARRRQPFESGAYTSVL